MQPEFSETSKRLSGLAILVVDDEDDARDVLRVVLMEEGASVFAARSGAAALAQLDVGIPDAMLVDLSMPVMDGFTLVGLIRQRPAQRGGIVPIGVLTGYISGEDRARALQLGVQTYLVKPVEPGELIAAILALVATAL